MFQPKRLTALRKKRSLTQEELAIKVNTTKGTISNYENGHSTPPHETLVALADTLKTTTDYLLGRSNQASAIDTPEEPVVQLLMRSKDEMSPESFDRLSRVIEELTKSFVEEVDSKLDGDKK